MSALPTPAPLREVAGPLDLAALRAGGQPVVLRGLAAHWPAVVAGRQGPEAAVNYLKAQGPTRPVSAIAAHPDEGGRFFYNADLTGMNFQRGTGPLALFLDDLLRAAPMEHPPALAVQSEVVSELLPAFAAENRLEPLAHVPPRIWIGNAIRVAAHYDVKENVAVCMAGRRRFTLFPPAQIANLYPGPLEQTPAGTPVSMVDLAAPDLARYPRFAAAAATAQEAVLEPGDAIYIPYCWWHAVQSLGSVNVLVNYWWSEGQQPGMGGAYDALLHAILSLKHLPEDQRTVWREWFDFYVFETQGDPAAHLPAHARGALGPPDPAMFAEMRRMLKGMLG
ncbi:cupin-like domain-containing protein [Alteraurantiacibacter buctensis]|uniref:cupin-like domain-containing protein n=1 Tax=Alteraurantiacibacter buctensis TaxID=1503981 RepID=UPI00301E1F82